MDRSVRWSWTLAATLPSPALMRHLQQNRCSQMAKTYQQIQVQIAALQKEADVARKREVQAVIRDIKASIAFYGLTAEDLGLAGVAHKVASARKQPSAKAAKPAAVAKKTRGGAKKTASKKPQKGAAVARFSDGAGNAWSGRGPRPGWLKEAIAQGKSAEDFRV